MKSVRLVAIASMLAFAAIHAAAEGIVRDRPDRDFSAEGVTEFVGNYGEFFKFRGGWQVTAEMNGGVEVVDYSPTYRLDKPGEGEPFHPTAADFEPENFSRLGLVQIVLMPKDKAPISDLGRLREEKLKTLKASGVDFEIFDGGAYPIGAWPAGTFEVRVTKPYLLSQLYTSNQGFVCIFTTGHDSGPSRAILEHSDSARQALLDFVTPAPDAGKRPTIPELRKEGVAWDLLASPFVLAIWAGATSFLLLLAGVLGYLKRLAALRRFALAVVVFANCGAAAGLVVGLVAWLLAVQNLPAVLGAAVLGMPAVALGLARLRSCEAPSARPLRAVGAWTLVSGGVCAYAALFQLDWGWHAWAVLPPLAAIVMFPVYGIAGFLFWIFDEGKRFGRAWLVFALVALLAPRIHADDTGVPAIDLTKLLPTRIVDGHAFARAKVEASGQAAEVEKEAIQKLKDRDLYFDLQRVEVDGIFTKADNESDPRFADLFDKHILPSNRNTVVDRSVVLGSAPSWLPRNVKPGSTVFVYFSGHGAPDPVTGKAFLVPFDGDPQFLDDTAYSVERLYKSLNALKARRVIVALDACFSGSGRRSVLAKGTRPLVTRSDLGAGRGRVVSITAAQGTQVAGTFDEEGHGLFTYFFLKGLNGEAEDGLGRVTLSGLFDYLSPLVADAARRDNRAQNPQMSSVQDVVLR